MANFTPAVELTPYLEKIKFFEQPIPWMYSDSVGKITVGAGHNVTAHNDYLTLDFAVKRFERQAKGGDAGVAISKDARKVDRTASKSEIQNDFDFLTKHSGEMKKLAAKYQQKFTTLELRAAKIDSLFRRDASDAINICVTAFADFASYPIPCQGALIDIAFNVGSFKTFHTIRAALTCIGAYAGKDRDADWKYERWKVAASHSKRGKLESHDKKSGKIIHSERNLTIQNWFLQGAQPRQKAVLLTK